MDTVKYESFKLDFPIQNYISIYDKTFRIARYYPTNYNRSLDQEPYISLMPPGYGIGHFRDAFDPYGANSIEEAISFGLINLLFSKF